jgi:hypothetical protein
VNDPIIAGNTITLTTVFDDYSALGISEFPLLDADERQATLYAQVDSVGGISEPDEENNIYSIGTDICLTSQDSYEEDDTPAQARLTIERQSQLHNFDRPGDQDWLKFEAQAGVTYTLQTFDLDHTSDTFIYLYDMDGTTLLASNDDHGGELSSKLNWVAPADGWYYVLIQHWNPNVGGCGTKYNFMIGELDHQVFLPISAIFFNPPKPVNTLKVKSSKDDGEIIHDLCTQWKDCREGNHGRSYAYTDFENATVQSNYSQDQGWYYALKRSYFFFDTSGLPVNAEIVNVSLHFYVSSFISGEHTGVVLVPSTAKVPLNGSSFSRITYQELGSQYTIVANTWTEIILNRDSLNVINPGGTTVLALINELDYNNIVPSEENSLSLSMTEKVGFEPYLEIEYTFP